jgi:branched-chain amino acid aminotransferase
MSSNPQTAPFGSILAPIMATAAFRDGAWGAAEYGPVAPLPIHPAAHVLHYASECFEGFKAYRWPDNSLHVFRLDRHIARMQQSARSLMLPNLDPALLESMVMQVIDRNRASAPEAPGALYMRPMLIGTTPNIGAAATPSSEALLVVLASPVWDYFAGGARALRIYVEEHATRCASHLGVVKTGGNYAAALGPTLAARHNHQADQVLFAPGGEVQETGAANFLLIRDGHILTRSLDAAFLHGVTRDSMLVMAADLGYRIEERVFTVDEMLDWVKDGEAALSGTAAVLSGVGTLIRENGVETTVGSGGIGPNTQRLRAALVDIQQGKKPDPYGWLRTV